MTQTVTSAVLPCCTFRVGDDCFAIESALVVEVLRGGDPVRVPLAPDGVLGLVHLRGRIVPIIDLADRLGVAPRAGHRAETHLVICLQDDWYGLIVDEMLDVIDIPVAGIEHPTAASGEVPGEPRVGVFAATDRLVHVLDPQRMIQFLVRQRTQPPGRHGVSHG
jgi:purine-binding chemotaxis protein CheW